ncbi:hypothetical protein FA048_01785 [Pedobacter polaris]|uniref:Uncharacterized protein n=1 Tax=Pedobacter polaris TaxID=2571273 RepID=A0A4U1CU71_9SPHI|nr:hypothetical protein [Pedobacter polaris]TKC12374.1 hypothetical protein FA048_01785 [Pedobacter polaris]
MLDLSLGFQILLIFMRSFFISMLLFIGCFVLVSCNKRVDHFYSPDKKQCISIITEGNIRYIMDGRHNSVPKSDFVKIDLSKIDRHVADEIVGCWSRDKLKWIVIMDNVTILENKLDQNKFSFVEKFPIDSKGIPTLIDYNGKANCFNISYEYRTLIRINGSISE